MQEDSNSQAFSFGDASQDFNSITLTPSQTQASMADSHSYNMIADTEKERVIWGTSINIEETINLFKNKIQTIDIFKKIIQEMFESKEYVFRMDCELIKDSILFEQLYLYPQEVLPILEQSIKEVLLESYPNILPNNLNPNNLNVKIRPQNIGKPISMRTINPLDIDKIVSLKGLITRTSNIIPDLVKATFKCTVCFSTRQSDCIKNIISEPTICDCGAQFSFRIMHNEGVYLDSQHLKLQELPECVPSGTTPLSFAIVSTEDLIDVVKPGDRVDLVGILRAVPVKLNSFSRKIKGTFRSYIELLSIQSSKNEQGSTMEDIHANNFILNKENSDLNLKEAVKPIDSENLIKDLKKIGINILSNGYFTEISRLVAPSVFGLEDTKKVLLLQLVSGTRKNHPNTSFRGDIHVLLAGDPGVAKSQLLTFIHSIVERGIYTSGRGSSAVGLTASVTRDIDTGKFVLEPGALSLSTGGVCCIDEFDKMNDVTRAILHEAMEQQTVSIAKAGIVTSLNAQCGVLASCNPVDSKWNVKKSIISNVNLGPALLSRFDVVSVLIDKADFENDVRVGKHLIEIYSNQKKSKTEKLDLFEDLDKDLNSENKNSEKNADSKTKLKILKNLIKEAKKIIPILTEEAKEILKESYIDMRNLNSGNTITATTRQLESMIRLSEAHAKCRLSARVEAQDVKEAVRLIKSSMLLYAIDPKSGRIDLDLVLTGISKSEREFIIKVKDQILENLRNNKIYKNMQKLKEKILENAEENIFKKAVDELVNEEVVFVDQDLNTIETIL